LDRTWIAPGSHIARSPYAVVDRTRSATTCGHRSTATRVYDRTLWQVIDRTRRSATTCGHRSHTARTPRAVIDRTSSATRPHAVDTARSPRAIRSWIAHGPATKCGRFWIGRSWIVPGSFLERTWVVAASHLDRADFRRWQVGTPRSLRGLDGLDRRSRNGGDW
jgi:hypothetical protein